MCKLPHEYLQSSRKEDIKIIFEFRHHKPVVILWYTCDGRIFECHERIISADMLCDHIQCAEEQLMHLIKETL